jgi:glycosyltransferase involved in cell wall biosynthesis
VRVDGKFLSCGRRRVRIQGVSYGPFAANHNGEPFPTPERASDDFARMRAAGINAVRTYHVPPEWLLNLADEQGMGVLVDAPWSKHLCFLDSSTARKEARQIVLEVAKRGTSHRCILAYSIGNEIPPSIVRWHGTRHVERFLAELMDTSKQVDPDALVTYANYPPTEYLDLSFLDFATFNVYLHDHETFCRYLFRLQNLVDGKPLVLGELGMDTLRHGEVDQAQFLAGHVREALLTGLAGTFIFSWTDDWCTGGYPIRDWAFGITYADRLPKASYHALREVFERSPAALLPSTPRVSVIVCAYNGGCTLEQCLDSLLAIEYPDYEVIVVDDGSTDDTPSILKRFPSIRAIHQPNQGLSAARNVGLKAATGSIVAYTDADCFADAHWLAQLVHQFQRSNAAAVGGPNLTPQDGWRATCVAASPGQPTHVLESDQVAEHIPGCNMAFRREVLLAINAFDTLYRKAGDDVDICWRLQQAGHWIAFAPGAVVWHHRRQNPRAYFRQQAGYGEAEALLQFKHPDKFNHRGASKWRGVLYGPSLQGLSLSKPLIYRGTYGTGLFQCIYRVSPAHWAMLPSTLEWHLAIGLAGIIALFWPPAWIGAALMLSLSLAVAALQAAQARLAPKHDGFVARLLVMGLCYAQPLVRSWWRYRTRLFCYRPRQVDPGTPSSSGRRMPLTGVSTAAYWSEAGAERTEFLAQVVAYLAEHRWGRSVDSGWSDWDLEVYCHPWTVVQVCTAQEEHGGKKHLIRVRYRLRPSGYMKALAITGVSGIAVVALLQAWPFAIGVGLIFPVLFLLWWRGARRASYAVAGFDAVAERLGLIRCGRESGEHTVNAPLHQAKTTADKS